MEYGARGVALGEQGRRSANVSEQGLGNEEGERAVADDGLQGQRESQAELGPRRENLYSPRA